MAYRAVIIRCTNCNAVLEIASTVTAVTCSYCGVVSRIQAKTAMFEVPTTLPQAPQARLEQLQRLQHLMPVRPAAAVRWPLFVTLAMLVGGVGMSLVIAKRGGIGAASKDRSMWAGRSPMLIDLDGDGTRDVIGLVRYVLDEDRCHLAAFDGKTGKQRWQSESLGAYSALSQAKFAGVGSQILMASAGGSLSARDAKTGAQVWEVALDEKVDIMCAAGEQAVIVGTADQRWVRLDNTGAQQPASKLLRLDRDYTNDKAYEMFQRAGVEQSDVCVSLGHTFDGPSHLLSMRNWGDTVKVENMRIERFVRRAGSPDTLAVGYKSPGTSVPMLAKLDGSKAAWVAEIPAKDPLVSRFEEKNVALSDGAVFALYTTSSPEVTRLTAISLSTGKRLWDRQIPTTTGFVPEGLSVTGDVVLLASWQHLHAYSVLDGSDRYRIGSY